MLKNWVPLALLALTLLVASLSDARARVPDAAGSVVELRVHPASLVLEGERSRGRLAVTGLFANGEVRDLTEAVSVYAPDSHVAGFEDGIVVPRSDGETLLLVRLEDLAVELPVTVRGLGAPDPVDFIHEVLPALTQPGCNGGSCHGSPAGKGEFSLSLYAFDAENDHRVLTRGGFARRVNTLEPDESLLLEKPTLQIAHGGGRRLSAGDPRHEILRGWIAEGAGWDRDSNVTCERLEVLPEGPLLRRFPHARQQLVALAHYSDGSTRDVTELVSWFSSDDGVATIDETGLVQGAGRGQTAIVGRYLDALVSKPVTFVEDVEGFDFVAPPEHGPIDAKVNEKLRQLQYAPAETCDDATFLRRLFLDLTGLLPTVDEARAFLADEASDKRARVIDRLLESDEHARYWAQREADLLRLTPEALGENAQEYADHLARVWRENVPYDRHVRDLLTADGPASNYYRALPDATTLTEATTQVFLGSRLECAKCHNHPYERWTQDDYYSIASAFDEEVVHPRRKTTVAPWPRKERMLADLNRLERRDSFANWLTREDDELFARVEANRLWANLFGRGIVDPVDDFRSSNPPANPALLDYLARRFEESGFDRRALLREILNSQTYQRISGTTAEAEPDLRFFSRQKRRLLPAEALLDAVTRVTDEQRFRDATALLAARAVDLEGLKSARLPGRAGWIADSRARLEAQAPPSFSTWRSLGPFLHPDAFATSFGPELEGDAPGAGSDAESGVQLTWVEHPEWVDGRVHALGLPNSAAVYLQRTIESPVARELALSLGSDDGLRVWCNGEEVLARDVGRPAKRGQEHVMIALRPGDNVLLMKVNNGGGVSGFVFEAEVPEFDDALRTLLAELDAADPDGDLVGISPALDARLTERFFAARPDVARLQAEVDRLDAETSGWFASQQPLAATGGDAPRTELLQAFGQPPRQTSCACERKSEPTLAQALQLLNGRFVAERVAWAAKRLASEPVDAAFEELTLATLGRVPSERERTVARAHLASADASGLVQAWEDLIWALINHDEFLFQR